MLTWYLAQIAGSTERKTFQALREHRFTVYRPMETKWKSTPRGQRERVEVPLFPGYLFVGVGPGNRYDHLHDINGLTRIVPTSWPRAAFAGFVQDLAFRQLAGEFDSTGTRQYMPPKPLVGPLAHSIGHGMSALSRLLAADEGGRVRLLLSGALVEGGEAVEGDDKAA